MKNETVFGRWEANCLLIILIGAKIFLNFPRVIEEIVGNAGWILVLVTTVLAFILFYIITRLYEPFEGMDLIDIADRAMGSAGKLIVGGVLIAYLIFTASIMLREFGEDMKTISFAMSPISFMLILFIAGMIAAAYFGLEPIVRIAAILTPVIVAGYLIIILGVIPYYRFNNLYPLLGHGVDAIAANSIPQLSMFSLFEMLFLITPYIKTNKNMKRVGYSVLGASCFALITSTLVYALVYPYPIALENFLPIYQLARLINIGRFFQRIESMFVFIWAAGALLHLSATFYLAIHLFAKILRLKYQKPLIIPFAILVFNISLLPPSLMETIKLETQFSKNYFAFISFGLPILVLLIARIRKRMVKGALEYSER